MGGETREDALKGEASVRLGLYGKLPSHGDFIARGLNRDFIDPWDEWLCAGLELAASAAGNDWIRRFRNAPAWSFAIAAGACGPCAAMGLLLPSHDRVGREFPLTLTVILPRGTSILRAALGSADWFHLLQSHAPRILGDPQTDADAIWTHLSALAQVPSEALARKSLRCERPVVPQRGHHVRLMGHRFGSDAAYSLLETLMTDCLEAPTLWWTAGTDGIDADVLCTSGLPRGERFVALFDGAWAIRGWNDWIPQNLG